MLREGIRGRKRKISNKLQKTGWNVLVEWLPMQRPCLRNEETLKQSEQPESKKNKKLSQPPYLTIVASPKIHRISSNSRSTLITQT